MRPQVKEVAKNAGMVGAGVLLSGGVTAVTLAAYFARKVLTPDREWTPETEILAVTPDAITLRSDAETTVPGRYAVWSADLQAHTRVGEVIGLDEEAGTVTRRVIGVDYGQLEPGMGHWSGYYFAEPVEEALGIPVAHVAIPGELGQLPAWRIAPDTPTGESSAWGILVHGRGALREECVRGIAPLRAAGCTVLVPAYRNDRDAVPGPDGRYTLGLSEWRDIEAAVAYAVSQGAQRVVLGGWSMGGAICLQFLSRSSYRDLVVGAFLDCAVIDWNDVIAHHAILNHVPTAIALMAMGVMGRRSLHYLAGVSEAVDVAQTDWVRRAEELRHPLLVMHSVDDDFVPYQPAAALAAARPDLVHYEEWTQARHCKLWNTDSDRWESLVTQFALSQLGSRPSTG